jgi:hypothetical protein
MKKIVIYNVPKNGIELLTTYYNVSNTFLEYCCYLAYFRFHGNVYDGWNTYDKFLSLENFFF